MKKIILTLLLVSLAIGHVAANAFVVDGPSGASAVSSTGVSPPAEYVAGACHFRIANLFGGHFTANPKDSPPVGVYHFPSEGPFKSSVLYGGLSILCVNAADSDKIATRLGAKQVDGVLLQPYFSDPSWAWKPFDKKQHAEIVSLRGKNWSGSGVLVDDTTGDEQTRSRNFSFCLIHDAHALCGDLPVMYLSEPKVDELWKIKAILNSVEFIDGPISTVTDGVKPGSTASPAK